MAELLSSEQATALLLKLPLRLLRSAVIIRLFCNEAIRRDMGQNSTVWMELYYIMGNSYVSAEEML